VGTLAIVSRTRSNLPDSPNEYIVFKKLAHVIVIVIHQMRDVKSLCPIVRRKPDKRIDGNLTAVSTNGSLFLLIAAWDSRI
jgi:hypothetical protein